MVRFIGIDIGQQACEVAIGLDGVIRSAGRITTTRAQLELFAQSLGPDDHVAMEAGSSTLEIARILEPHVARVVVANTKKLRQISHAKAKTDTLDARTLARLLAAGMLDAVWLPDEQTRAQRRWIARRAAGASAHALQERDHAVLARNLIESPAVSDLFGKRGRAWLDEQRLAADEQTTVKGCLRQIAFLDGEIAIIERELARHALSCEQIRRLMTVPGVDLIVAATFMAQIGDIRRFAMARHLVGYLGLDPRVRQSGAQPARHGRISKKGRLGGPPRALRGREVRRADRGPIARVRQAHPRPARQQRRGDRRRAQAVRRVLAPADPRRGLRLRTPIADQDQAAASGTARRRPATPRPARRHHQALPPPRGPRARARTRPASRTRLRTPRRRLEADQAKGRGRDTGARISQRPSKGKAARQTTSP